MIPISINKDVFESSYNDLKFIAPNHNYVCTNLIIHIQHILPTINKFVYSCSVKICASGFDGLLQSIFCLLLVVEAFFPAKKSLRRLKKW